MEEVAEVSVEVKKIPGLRFPEFEGEWVSEKLKEIQISIIDGDRGTNYPNGTDFSGKGYCLFLNAKNVTKSGFSFNELSFISKEKDEKLNKGKLQRNDIVLTTRGSLGHVAYYNSIISYEHLRINSGMVIIRTNGKMVDTDYLYKYLNSIQIQREIEKIAFGSAQPQLTVKGISRFPIVYPSLPEQQKIASFLSAVDDKIQQLSRKKELLEQYKKGVMQQIFSRQIRFKDERGQDFPEWEEKALGDIAKEIKRKAKKDDNIERLEVLTITAGTGFVSQKERFSQVIAGQSLTKYTLLREGELSYNRGASKRFQFGCIYPLSSFELALVPNIYISFAFAKAGDTGFYSQLFSTGYANRQLRKFISSSARLDGLLNINKNDFFSLRIPVPSLAEQKKISNFLKSIDSKINFTSKQLEQAQQFKKGLLQQMFI